MKVIRFMVASSPGWRVFGTHRTQGWVNPRHMKWKFLPLARHLNQIIQSIAGHCTDWNTWRN